MNVSQPEVATCFVCLHKCQIDRDGERKHTRLGVIAVHTAGCSYAAKSIDVLDMYQQHQLSEFRVVA